MTAEEYGAAYERGRFHTRRAVLRWGIPPDEAEELVQAAWARGWEYLHQLRQPDMVVYWVNEIARNLNRLKRRAHQVSERYVARFLLENPRETHIDLAPIELRKLLAKLSPKDRTLLELELAGFTAPEIKPTFGISSSGTRVLRHRARQKALATLTSRSTKPMRVP